MRRLICRLRGHVPRPIRIDPPHPGELCGRCGAILHGGRWVWTGLIAGLVVLLGATPSFASERNLVREKVRLVEGGTSAYETYNGMPHVRKPRCEALPLERKVRWTSIRLRRLETALGLRRGPVYSCRKEATPAAADRLFWRFVAVETFS
jgi:hypothetical protein